MPLKIVYVDDEPMLLELFVDLYADQETLIRTFEDPESAIQSVRADPPDLLLLDYRLPGTNGDLIAQKLNLKIPMALVTGDLSVHPTAPFLRVFPKPHEPEVMKEFIESIRSQQAQH